MSNRGTLGVNFTIGFGNNLFQYCYARLLAEKNNLQLQHRAIPEMGIEESNANVDKGLPTIVVNDTNYKKVFFTQNLENCNVAVNGYFEDYKIFELFLDQVRGWFKHPGITNKTDLILHLRLQNRLIQVSHNKNHISSEAFKNAINGFQYERLHIVTDAPKWSEYNLADIEKLRSEIRVGPNPPSNSPWVEAEQSLDYINHLVDGLSNLQPIVHCTNADTIKGSGGLRGSFMNDFNLLRSFDQVIVFNSTFSWWAATLSGAKRVGIFSPWKIAKAEHQRRNLGSTNFPGWFSWGGADDLYFKQYGIK
jgi:hypothetical protein|tara:strand:+ start:328 stop:1248 length:921 start_codon:yes stop_codon:yes gene_type:complete